GQAAVVKRAAKPRRVGAASVLAALAAAVIVTLAAVVLPTRVVASGPGGGAPKVERIHRTITITAYHSRFSPATVDVPAGAGVVLGRRRLRLGARRGGRRQDGVGLLAGSHQIVVLAGQALDLGVGVEALHPLGHGCVLGAEDGDLALGGHQLLALGQPRTGRE